MISIKAPAKINLCLNIKGKRPDGYHELETIMQTIDVYDQLTIRRASEFNFICSDPQLQENNLAEKAAKIFFSALGQAPQAVINLHKNIPHGAGLGGGSSDAAAVLLGLNRLHANHFNYKELWQMACSLGADAPFFLTRGSALCSGIGHNVQPWPDFPLGHYLLVKPPRSLATAQVYGNLDIKNLQFERVLSKISPLSVLENDINSILNNDLERAALAFYPELLTIKEEISALGAGGVLMSGSGSTVFGLFAERELCKKAASMLTAVKPNDWWIVACNGIIAEF